MSVCVATGCKQLLKGPVVSLPAVEGKVTVNYSLICFFGAVNTSRRGFFALLLLSLFFLEVSAHIEVY